MRAGWLWLLTIADLEECDDEKRMLMLVLCYQMMSCHEQMCGQRLCTALLVSYVGVNQSQDRRAP